MLTPSEVLLQTLEDLESEDFQVFKWFLEQRGILEDLPWVPVSRLESANRVQTVDQIMKVHGLHCIKVTKSILLKMNMSHMKNLISPWFLG
uniref:Pyrin domain-containing protein n=1 Tax=Neogobius melanostomus TaxID=47308 RepID=A0A8C6TYS1_9GOBI